MYQFFILHYLYLFLDLTAYGLFAVEAKWLYVSDEGTFLYVNYVYVDVVFGIQFVGKAFAC